MRDEPIAASQEAQAFEDLDGELLQESFAASMDRLVFRGSFGGTRKPVRVRVTDGVLLLDDKPVPTEHCVSGSMQLEQGGEVRLRLVDTERQPRVDLLLPSKESARQVMGALGLNADRVAVPFTATHTLGAFMGVMVLLFGVMVAFATTLGVWWLRAMMTTSMVMLAALMIRMARYPFLVAPDGIWFRRYGREHLLDWASIESAEASGDTTVSVTMRDGRVWRFDFATRDSTGVPDMEFDWHHRNWAMRRDGEPYGSTNETVAALLKGHLEAAAKPAQLLRRSLERGGRSMQKWLSDLDQLARGSYRSEAVTAQRLWQLVEDGSVPHSARAAAGWLLRSESEQADQRLRIAASHTASPRLRIALNAMAEYDEEAQREALAAMEADEQEQATRTHNGS